MMIKKLKSKNNLTLILLYYFQVFHFSFPVISIYESYTLAEEPTFACGDRRN